MEVGVDRLQRGVADPRLAHLGAPIRLLPGFVARGLEGDREVEQVLPRLPSEGTPRATPDPPPWK